MTMRFKRGGCGSSLIMTLIVIVAIYLIVHFVAQEFGEQISSIIDRVGIGR